MSIKHWLVPAAIVACSHFSASAQTLVNLRTLSLDAAVELANATLAECRKSGYKVTVTVLDNRGGTRVILHDDGANPHTIENSMRKAYTSLTFRTPSGEYGKRVAANPQQAGALHLDRVTTLEGALPIMAGKDLVGSVGVSGAPGGDKDAVCAQAGIDRISKGLGGG